MFLSENGMFIKIEFCICGTTSIFSFHRYCSHDRHYAMMCAMHSVRKIHQVRF
ncbi:Uncharacterised protein [Vibrio cholerae]|nr:Uncharacterised protein [Vibrio cholerae]